MYSDIEVKRRVDEELRWEPRVDAANIAITVEDNVVTLTGSVAEQWAAERAAERAPASAPSWSTAVWPRSGRSLSR